MKPATDPYRTLGLDPGATPAEIKRAYRRLAKAYHPDSAGDRALPRFLAIQAAYERLTAGQPSGPTSDGRGQPARRGSSQGPTTPPASRPWSADAQRARAARDPFRPRAARSGGGPAGAAAGPAGGAGQASRNGPTGTSSGATSGPGSRAAGAGRGPGRRARPKATIGSTSYDGTENEPFEPGWSGATWYGADSGTYWTINPKEYADPRKHGPEYLARARRNRRPEVVQGEPAGASDAAPDAADGSGHAGRRAEASPEGRGPTADDLPPADAGDRFAFDPAGASSVASASSKGTGPTGWLRRSRPVTVGSRPAGDLPPVGQRGGRRVVRFSSPDPARAVRSWRGRLVLAALAWFPIGLAIFGIHGQLTGCAQFMASCTDPVAWSVWIPQAIVVVLLLISPRLAWIAASGSVMLIALTAPLAAILTAGSGGRPPSSATTELLLVAMVVGWLGGVGIALSGRIPLPPWRAARVR
jgi:hypothetical protein